jgi:hypothetical protein
MWRSEQRSEAWDILFRNTKQRKSDIEPAGDVAVDRFEGEGRGEANRRIRAKAHYPQHR